MDALSLYIPITKVDAAQRLVYGLATAEVEDRSGEVCDYASTKPNYEKWSGDIAKTTNGKSYGNLRAMHGPVAAGKVTSIAFNDDAKQIEICAKVVDDGEWNKVQEGVYTGFSQGGSYERRWTDDGGLTRYTASPSEISLVDLPCLPEATFQMIKADGTAEARHFQKKAGNGGDGADGDAADGEEKPAKAVFSPREGEDWEQVFLSKRDGRTFPKKDQLRAHLAALDAEAAIAATTQPALDALDELGARVEKEYRSKEERAKDTESGAAMPGGRYPIKSAADIGDAVKDYNRTGQDPKVKAHIIARAKALGATDMLPADWEGSTKKPEKAAKPRDLGKGLGTVAALASIIDQLDHLYDKYEGEADVEDDNSPVCGQFKAAIGNVCETLKAMVEEETSELMSDTEAEDLAVWPPPMMMALGALKPDVLRALAKFAAARPALAKYAPGLEKFGARHSSADLDKIQAMHDAAVDLGAKCASGDKMAMMATPEMVAALKGDLEKRTAENSALHKTINEQLIPRIKDITDALAAQDAKIQKINDQPLPLPLQSSARTVDKGHEMAPDRTPEEALLGALANPETAGLLAKLAIRAAQQNGVSYSAKGRV